MSEAAKSDKRDWLLWTSNRTVWSFKDFVKLKTSHFYTVHIMWVIITSSRYKRAWVLIGFNSQKSKGMRQTRTRSEIPQQPEGRGQRRTWCIHSWLSLLYRVLLSCECFTNRKVFHCWLLLLLMNTKASKDKTGSRAETQFKVSWIYVLLLFRALTTLPILSNIKVFSIVTVLRVPKKKAKSQTRSVDAVGKLFCSFVFRVFGLRFLATFWYIAPTLCCCL